MANKILVFVEQRNGQVKKAAFEAVKFASDLASKLGGEINALTIGSDINDLNKVGGFGVSSVTHLKSSELDNYSASAYSKLVIQHANEIAADIIVFSNTSLGKDLAPRVSIKLDAGIIVDAIACDIEGEELIITRPVYAGKALTSVKFNSSKKVITIRPNVFNAGESSNALAEVETKEVSDVDLSTKVVELKKSEGKLDVAEADIIVSGGRGMKGPENFHLIEELAEVLGAASGASRAVVDAGWRPHAEQVGQTGKTVSPTLYIAVGISGAIQHLAGMRSSKYIVAINKDKDAPIFQVADYGIAGDAFEVLPKLIEEVKKIKE
jgi:electron transfer flavoprotein alpha subunit